VPDPDPFDRFAANTGKPDKTMIESGAERCLGIIRLNGRCPISKIVKGRSGISGERGNPIRCVRRDVFDLLILESWHYKPSPHRVNFSSHLRDPTSSASNTPYQDLSWSQTAELDQPHDGDALSS
jgi:hypothetical protein